jgi:phage-related protein
MAKYEIVFYTTPRGEALFQKFLDSMTDKLRSKVMKLLDLLEEHGPNLKRPYSDMLRDGIRELRCQQGHNNIRAFYFFFQGKKIIITHGLIKKTDKVPPTEIDKAVSYKRDFEIRYNSEEIN